MMKQTWNNHGLRTSSHQTPLLWELINDKEGHKFSEVSDDDSVDWERAHTPSTSNISVPEFQPLSPLRL
ncbi:hypothetical protein CHARACLAT_003203 [Characodon lateralis]|uniref:Uncharacterized protein n=1 Tax=Characodon lateralis TaxID=208331 RepID=A0ABU7D629_9TELE|nr:hypothetical protein [Characodon lateralis]